MFVKSSFMSLMLTVFILFSSAACTQDKEQPKQNENIPAIAMNNSGTGSGESQAADVPVFTMGNVVKGRQGKISDFTWTDKGKTYKFSDYTKNKVVLLNFWGTWCGPCRAEIPDIIKLVNEMKGRDFMVIGIAYQKDEKNALRDVSNFVKANGINYINFIFTPEIIDAYGGLTGVPTTFIIDKSGSISETIVGGREKGDFLKSINRVLK